MSLVEVLHKKLKQSRALSIFFQQTEAAAYELRTSNMAYVSNRLTVLDKYSDILKNKYLSSASVVDFDNAEPVRQEINTAVEKETNSRIKDLIPAGELTKW